MKKFFSFSNLFFIIWLGSIIFNALKYESKNEALWLLGVVSIFLAILAYFVEMAINNRKIKKENILDN